MEYRPERDTVQFAHADAGACTPGAGCRLDVFSSHGKNEAGAPTDPDVPIGMPFAARSALLHLGEAATGGYAAVGGSLLRSIDFSPRESSPS
jgi:hypothetical protein